ncbi:flagella basal body P-ring formation protein FlgA [Pseudidiomarina planktonica]|uniref:Flagella basal body P-ring formation protein FlgA n=1 Tax=Pseudidiomarina planktonica TaxID=1323738 RepID=A0A1Y6EHB5_9GAMM|nr:flagellar basal body P-ring formation chaperone FlgA [Pseudidiomarina planktonica]SMQ62018.1 flagella basal body P-ring formation protein FlgA [Pseudidiomarina planktonica]
MIANNWLQQRLTKNRLLITLAMSVSVLPLYVSAAAENIATANTAAESSAAATKSTAMSYDYHRLRDLAESYVLERVTAPAGGKVTVEAGGLDARMAPRQCAEPARIQLANNANMDRFSTVEISCEAGAPWRSYVPVRIYMMAPVVTAKRPLSPGTLLTEDDLEISLVDTQMIRSGLYNSVDKLLGSRVKRRINASDPIIERNTCLVCEGEKVTIVAALDGMRVSATGVALNDGLLGESVSVRNQASNREVSAVVAALNEVKVNL